jgi:integration host factor subunit beta
MIKSELVQRIRAQNPHLFQHHVENLINAILDEIVSAIARGDRVELRGFGMFAPRVRAAHVGRNPKAGTDVPVPRKVAPYFRPGKEMRERLNQTPTG